MSQHLVQQYTMTAILETHVTGAKADLFFCRYVEGTHRFFIHGMAILVQEAWADLFNPALVTVVDGVHCALVWECGIPCTARRGDDLPHARTSDHWPVGLRWSSAKKTWKPQISSDNIVHETYSTVVA